MELRAGARLHAHQRHDHAVAFDARTEGARIIGAALDLVDLRHLEEMLARGGALGARCTCRRRHGRGLGHASPPVGIRALDERHRLAQLYTWVPAWATEGGRAGLLRREYNSSTT